MFLFWVCSCFFDKNPPFGCSLPGCRRSESCSFWWWWGRYIHAGCKNGTGAEVFSESEFRGTPKPRWKWWGLEYEFQWFPFSKGPVFSGSSPFFYGGVCKKIPTWDSRKLLKLKSYETPGFDQIRWTATSKCKRPATCVFFSEKKVTKKRGSYLRKVASFFCRAICGIAIMGGFAVKFHAKFDLLFS